MEIETLIGIIIVVPIFYLIGKWLDLSSEDKSDKKVIEAEPVERIEFTRPRKPLDPISIKAEEQRGASLEILVGVFVLFSFLL